jgi:Ni,Fe-hydrogenase maturation factor
VLVPELAESVAGVGRVVFVDAQMGGAVAVRELDEQGEGPLTHATDPRAVLGLAARVFGRRPRAWIVTVPAFDTGIGEGLSAETEAAVEQAVDAVLALLR